MTLENLAEIIQGEFLLINQRIGRVEEDVMATKGEVVAMRVEITSIKSDVAVIKDDVLSIKTDVALLSGRLDAVENHISSFDRHFETLEEKMQNGFYSIIMEIRELRKLIKEVDTPQLKELELRVAAIEKQLGMAGQ